MSHDLSSPPPNTPPSSDSISTATPHELILLSVGLQGIAKILLDHGSMLQASAPEVSKYGNEQSTRHSTLLKEIAHMLLGNQHCCNLHEYVDTIYAELALILEILRILNEDTYTPALDLYVLRKNLLQSVRKLEELHVQLEPSYVLGKVTNPKQ